MAKNQNHMYQNGSSCVEINIDLYLITCEDNIFIPLIIISYVLHWHHKYLLHPGTERTEATINQHLYCPRIRNDLQKELNNYDT